MKEDSVVSIEEPTSNKDVLTEVLREGAQKLLAEAVQAERHCHVNRVGPQRPAWIPFQAAAPARSHTLNASFRNRLNVNLLRQCRWT